MFCTKCGAEVSEGSKFCTSCGNQISSQQPIAGTPQTVRSPETGIGRAVKQKNLFLCFFFTIITFGIYGVYWFIRMAGDIAKLRGQGSPNGFVDWFLGFPTIGLWWFVSFYRYGAFMDEIYINRGKGRIGGGAFGAYGVFCVWAFAMTLGLVPMLSIQSHLNELARAG